MTTIATSAPRVRPSGWWYLLCPIILVAGIVLAVQQGLSDIARARDSFVKLGTDGTVTLQLESGQKRTVWAVFSDVGSTENLARPTSKVTISGPSGSVDFDAVSGSSKETWSGGSDTGLTLGSFTAPDDGAYDVVVSYPLQDAMATAEALAPGVTETAGSLGPQAAVGDLQIMASIGRAARFLVLGFVGSLVVLIVLIVLRSRSKRRARTAQHAASGLGVPGSAPTPPAPTATPNAGPFQGNDPPSSGPITFG